MIGTQLIIFLLIIGFVAIVLIWHAKRAKQRVPFIVWAMVLVVGGVSLSTYLWLGEPQAVTKALLADNAQASEGSDFNTLQGTIDDLQNRLREDTQNGELWYALGNAYMYDNAFDKAIVAFGYAQRLADEPQANMYAALATASYYLTDQRFDEQAQTWLDKALALEPNNASALMLVASDYYLSARYQYAIDTWQQLLDSEQAGLDRVALITAINQAKQMQH